MEDRRVFGRIGVNFGLKFTDIASGKENFIGIARALWIKQTAGIKQI